MSETPDRKGEKMRDQTKDFEQAMDKIRNIMANTVSERDRAEKELELFRTEKWKDEELQKMKRERDEAVQDILRGFPVSEKEHIVIRKWMKEHMRTQHNTAATEEKNMKMSSIGGEFEYRFTPTAIGPFGSVVCTSCMRKVVKKVYSNGNTTDPAGEDMRKIREDIRRYTKELDAEFEFQIP